MKGNKILYAGASLAVLAIGFAAGTYAYYQNTITGTASGTVLAWNCTANTKGDGETFTISLGSLYPGSSGSKTITIASSILADYTVTFNTSSTPKPLTGEVQAGGTAEATFYYKWPYGTEKENYNSSAPSVSVTVTCSQK